MSESKSITLRNPQQAHRQLVELWEWVKAMLMAGQTMCIEVFPAKSREQEKLYHSCFNDLSKQAPFHGQMVEPEVWKRALLQAFYEVTKNDDDFKADWRSRAPQMIPTLDGDGFLMIGVESKRFTKNLARAFITFVHSEGDKRGVRWSKTSLGREWAGLMEEAA